MWKPWRMWSVSDPSHKFLFYGSSVPTSSTLTSCRPSSPRRGNGLKSFQLWSWSIAAFSTIYRNSSPGLSVAILSYRQSTEILNTGPSSPAGLICWGDHLNPTISGIDSNPCAIFDLQVLPNSDAAKGDTDTVTESEFLESLETALHQHANQYKVWNLLFGTDVVCSLSEFSPLAAALDDLQEQYQVSFVISAGKLQLDSLA